MKNSKRKGAIKVAIVGIGNCCSSLVQGVEYYKKTMDRSGLIFPRIDELGPEDIDFVCGFDIDSRKVGEPLSKAIFKKPNTSMRLVRSSSRKCDPIIQMGCVSDGVSDSMNGEGGFLVSGLPSVNIVEALVSSGAEVLVSYLPVGSVKATFEYANAALTAGCSFINCIPVPVSCDANFVKKFRENGLHVFGDDIKSQLGATITHQRLIELCIERGLVLGNTFQLNVGGNSDFKNMLDQSRLENKRKSKTDAVLRRSDYSIGASNVRIGPSDYVPFLKDEKRAYIEINAKGFANSAIKINVELSVQDSPNSAACVIDLIRFSRSLSVRDYVGRNAVQSFYMKSPSSDIGDVQAFELLKNRAICKI